MEVLKHELPEMETNLQILPDVIREHYFTWLDSLRPTEVFTVC